MKTTIRAIFASALVFSAFAPSLSQAAYLVDQAKTRALEAHAQAAMDRAARESPSKAWNQTFKFYGCGNTSVPGIGVARDDSHEKCK
jgi:hypothetical protein